MKCENAFELISASLDGELTAAEEAQLREHLAQCPACRALQAELAGLQEAAQAGLDAVAPPELKAAILENLPAQRKSAGKVVYWRRWGAMAAAVALVVLAAWQLPRFVFDPVDVAPAANESTTETTEAAADLPEEPAVTFSYAKDSTESADVDTCAGAIPNNGGADVDATLDAGATYGAATAKKESTPAPAPVSGIAAPTVNSAVANNAAPRAQAQPADTAAPEARSEDATEDAAPAQTKNAQNDVTDDLEAPIIATLTSGDAPSTLSLPLPSDATDEAIPAPTGGAGGGGSPSVPESGAVDSASVESRMAVLDANPATARWCGVLTLAEYEPAADYPMELTETGRRQYTLPAADFQALIETLDAEAAAYDLRTAGDDVSPDAPNGLVIVTGQPE